MVYMEKYAKVKNVLVYVMMFQPDYTAQAAACNLARNFYDIEDTWDSVKSVIKFYGDDEGNFSSVAKPGYFNDPDMVAFPIVDSCVRIHSVICLIK